MSSAARVYESSTDESDSENVSNPSTLGKNSSSCCTSAPAGVPAKIPMSPAATSCRRDMLVVLFPGMNMSYPQSVRGRLRLCRPGGFNCRIGAPRTIWGVNPISRGERTGSTAKRQGRIRLDLLQDDVRPNLRDARQPEDEIVKEMIVSVDVLDDDAQMKIRLATGREAFQYFGVLAYLAHEMLDVFLLVARQRHLYDRGEGEAG